MDNIIKEGSTQLLPLSISKGPVTNTVLTNWSPTMDELIERLNTSETGNKDGTYFIRGNAAHRADKYLNTGYVVILDGDKTLNLSSKKLNDGAPEPQLVHKALIELDVSHILYTTHSHRDDFPRYRVVLPVYEGFTKEQLIQCVDWLINSLHKKSVPLANVPENNKWSNAWYFPRTAEGQPFVSFCHIGSASLLKLATDNCKKLNKPKTSAQVIVQNKYSIQTIDQNRYSIANHVAIIAALRFISANNYDDWIKTGMAVSYELGEAGFEVFHNWSRHQPSYVDEADCRSTYDGFIHDTNTPVTIGTIQFLAEKDGWDKTIPNEDYIEILDQFSSESDLTSAIASIAVEFRWSSEKVSDIINSVATSKQRGRRKTALTSMTKEAMRKIGSTRKVVPCSEGEYKLNQELPSSIFPDVSLSRNLINLKSTSRNFATMLKAYGIKVYYDEVLKSTNVIIPGRKYHSDLNENAVLIELKSLCALNSLSKETVDYLQPLFAENAVNPPLEWITSTPWDGEDRINKLAQSIHVTANYINLRDEIIPLWLLQSIAALDHAEQTPHPDALPKFENVLVFQGDQGVKKTTWISRLLPPELRKYIHTGGHIEVGNRDSEKTLVSHFIVELGELDATFRKSDIAQLKGFLSKSRDQMRLPYERANNNYARRTSFIATVNDQEFLVDDTGNRRFWPLAVTKLDDLSALNMQQLWAQVWKQYLDGKQWWPNDALDKQLILATRNHQSGDHVADLLGLYLDLNNIDPADGVEMTTGEIMSKIPELTCNTANNRKIGKALRDAGFKQIRTSGSKKYRFKKNTR